MLLWHGHQADPSCSGAWAAVAKFLVGKCWTAMQRWGFRDPTRTANNPGRCDEVDDRLHAWATSGLPEGVVIAGGKKILIDTIIAGHTHRPVYKNLSLTERMYLERNISTQGIRRKRSGDRSYYNTGSCVYPRCITGLEITAGAITLVKWGYTAQGAGRALAIEREVLESN